MIRTQIQLTEDQARALRLLAADLDVSISELVRQAIQQLLSERAHLAARERMIAGTGGFHSGRSDVSEKHDRHLADAFDD